METGRHVQWVERQKTERKRERERDLRDGVRDRGKGKVHMKEPLCY